VLALSALSGLKSTVLVSFMKRSVVVFDAAILALGIVAVAKAVNIPAMAKRLVIREFFIVCLTLFHRISAR